MDSALMSRSLPAAHAERIRHVSSSGEGAFVPYWMRTALRRDDFLDNPASTQPHAADAGVPVFVYHGLSERYPHASDRHHTFILQGALDVQRALWSRRWYSFHPERQGTEAPTLRSWRSERRSWSVKTYRPPDGMDPAFSERAQTPVWVSIPPVCCR